MHDENRGSIMVDRKLNMKAQYCCIVRSSMPMYGLETVALLERQKQQLRKLQVRGNSWISRIGGVTRVERIRMNN